MRSTAATDIAPWDTVDTVVEMRSVVKYFEQVRPKGLFRRERSRVYALNDVSFSLKRGDFVAYAGPNGAGKSTTFRLLSGMLMPQQGEVCAFGSDPAINRIPMMRKTGILFGNRTELWYDHPVRTSFEWKKEVWDIEARTYNENLELLTPLLGLDQFWNTFARELSLGQRMRADLALAFLHSPELVLLDEPTLGLDVLAKRQMIEFLKLINAERGVTILVTSHDMDDLVDMARRIVLINHGKLAFDGDLAGLTALTGDRRILRLTRPGSAPVICGASHVLTEGDRHTYEYDGGEKSDRIFAELSKIDGAQDVELGRAPIESVIAEIYRKWQVNV